jgi:hypothetical protein
MFVPFNSLPETARVWVYQSARKLNESEKSTISDTLSAFTEAWVVHGQPLQTSFTILHNQFIVLAADESFNEASGCSIDSSVRIIRQIDAEFSLGLFDRTNIAFLKEVDIVVVKMNNLVSALAAGDWNLETLFFNNVIATKAELENSWLVPAGRTWLNRYRAKAVV